MAAINPAASAVDTFKTDRKGEIPEGKIL